MTKSPLLLIAMLLMSLHGCSETVLEPLPAPPSLAEVVIDPDVAYTDTLLSAVASGWQDEDGDPESYRFEWRADGEVVGGDSDELEPSEFVKGQEIQVAVTPFDAAGEGDVVTSAPVLILNTPPTSPTVEITPADPTDSVDLACSVSEESADLDEDTVTYSFEWLVDGESVGETGATLSHTLTSAGEVWTCVVTPHDGDEAGPSAEASVVPSLWDNDGDGTPFAEDCDDDDPSVALACCGNGVLEPGEDCEDGNVVDGDGCSVLCEFSCELPVSASELFGFDFETTSGWTSPCSGGASPSLTGGLSGSAWDWGGNHWGQRRMSLASVGAPPIALEYHVRFDESSTGSASVALGEYYTCSGAAQMVLRPAVYTSFSVDQSEFSLSNYLDASGSDVVAGSWSPVIGSWLEVRTFLNEDFQLGCVDGSPLVSANFDLSGLLIDEVQLGAWVSSSSGWDMPAFDELTVLAP